MTSGTSLGTMSCSALSGALPAPSPRYAHHPICHPYASSTNLQTVNSTAIHLQYSYRSESWCLMLGLLAWMPMPPVLRTDSLFCMSIPSTICDLTFAVRCNFHDSFSVQLSVNPTSPSWSPWQPHTRLLFRLNPQPRVTCAPPNPPPPPAFAL